MREVVGMDDAGMARFRADPVWPIRVAASHTIPRELEAERSPAAARSMPLAWSPSRSSRSSARRACRPSTPQPRPSTLALPRGPSRRIEGAAHAAHHSHPEAFVAAVESFLDGPPDAASEGGSVRSAIASAQREHPAGLNPRAREAIHEA